MATLPAGWAADYDGSRWFFVYQPTGHSQYQFPRPGDEFPDFGGGGGGLALGLAGLSPEERLESERQVRRHTAVPLARKEEEREKEKEKEKGLDERGHRRAGEGGAVSSKGADVGAGGGNDDDDDEGGDGFCFESFGFLGPAGLDRTEGLDWGKTKDARQRGVSSGGGTGLPHVSPPTSVDNTTPRASISEPSAAETFSATGEAITADARRPEYSPGPSQHGRTRPAAVSELPAATVPETTGHHHHHHHHHHHRPPAQPDGNAHRQLQEAAAAAAAPDMPMLDGRAVDSVPQPQAFSPGLFMPELYSELTALCEDEVNPPPAELPDNGASWLEPVPVPNLLNQYPVELPAGGFGRDGEPGGRPSPGGAPDGGDDARGAGGSRGNGFLRANTMPPALPPKEPLDEALHGEIMGYFSGCPSTTPAAPQSQPTTTTITTTTVQEEALPSTTATGTGDRHHAHTPSTRVLTHFPSVLRPGPRRQPSQPPPPPPPPPPQQQQQQQQPMPSLRHSATEPTTTTAQRAAHAWPSPPGHRHDTVLAELPSQASFRSVAIGPPAGKPRPVVVAAAGEGRAAAAAAVNFVIPIDHTVSSRDRHGSGPAAAVEAAAAAVSSAQETMPTPTPPPPPPPEPEPEPEYDLSANFAYRPPAPRPRDARGGAAVSGAPSPPKTRAQGENVPPSRDEGERHRPAATPPPRLPPGGPAKAAPEWSWGYAR